MAGVQTINLANIATANLQTKTSRKDSSSNQFNDFLSSQKTSSDSNGQKQSTLDKNASVQKGDTLNSKYDNVKSEVIKEAAGNVKDVDEKTIDVVSEEIKDIIKDTIDVDDEAIQSVLDSMGIVITDLLKPEVLQQFVLQLNGASESTELLTNESLMSDFSNLLQNLGDYVEENSTVLTTVLEQLDKPVALDEFGLSEEDLQKGTSDSTAVVNENADMDENIEVTSKDTVLDDENQVVSATKTEKDVVSVKDDVVKAKDGQDDSNMKNIMVSKELTDESGMSSNSEEESNTSESDLQKLFSSDATQSTSSKVSDEHSAFTQQLNVVQGNVTQVYDASLVSGQRMQQMVNIVNQVSEQMQQSVNENTTTLEMQLNPESLGKVLLSITAKEGMMTATFHVQSEEAKQALETQMYTLRENLEAKNLKVESVDVQISDFNFEQSTEAEAQRQGESDKNSKKKFNYDVAEDEEEISAEENAEQIRKQVMRDSGSSIDFTA